MRAGTLWCRFQGTGSPRVACRGSKESELGDAESTFGRHRVTEGAGALKILRWGLEPQIGGLGACFVLRFDTLRLHFDALSYTFLKTSISSGNTAF